MKTLISILNFLSRDIHLTINFKSDYASFKESELTHEEVDILLLQLKSL